MRQLYSVFDRKASAYGPIVVAAHDAVATRDFVSLVQDPQTTVSRYPEDFELHKVGTLDDGDVDGIPVTGCVPVVVVTASAVKAMQAPAGKPELLKEA